MVFRRIYMAGNSVVVTLPAFMLDQLGVSVGDYLGFEVTPGPYLKATPSSCASTVAMFYHEKERERKRKLAEQGRRAGAGGAARECDILPPVRVAGGPEVSGLGADGRDGDATAGSARSAGTPSPNERGPTE